MILAILFFIVITLPVRMTHSIPNILYHMLVCTNTIERKITNIGLQLCEWTKYLLLLPIAWMIFITGSTTGFILSPIIYFWNLIWHPDGRSILDILRDPNGNGWGDGARKFKKKRASTNLSPRQKYVQGLFHAGSGVANPDLSDATSGEADTMSFLLGANEVTARSTSANTTTAKSGSAIALGKRLLGEQ